MFLGLSGIVHLAGVLCFQENTECQNRVGSSLKKYVCATSQLILSYAPVRKSCSQVSQQRFLVSSTYSSSMANIANVYKSYKSKHTRRLSLCIEGGLKQGYFQSKIQTNREMVLIQRSVSSPSTPTDRVRILLATKIFYTKQQKRPGLAHLKKITNKCKFHKLQRLLNRQIMTCNKSVEKFQVEKVSVCCFPLLSFVTVLISI